MEYKDYIKRLKRQCHYFYNTPWSQTRGNWLYKELQLGADTFGIDQERIYDDIIKSRRHSGILPYEFNIISRRPVLANIRYVNYSLWGWILDAVRNRDYANNTADTHPSTLPTPTHNKRASIVVVSYNRLDYLKTTLNSLLITTHKDAYELIVVDNASTDGSVEYLRQLACENRINKLILRSRNHGISPGFNCGFCYADPTTDYLVKLDSDIKIMNPGWFDKFVHLFEHDKSIGLLALNQINNPILRVLPTDSDKHHPLLNWTHLKAGGACMTIPRTVFNRIGYFNESFDFTYMPDDIDYYWRICMLGLDAYYTRQFSALHRMDLDLIKYHRYSIHKILQFINPSKKAKQLLSREYLCDKRSPVIFYDHYKNRAFPSHTNILEID